MTKRRGNNEGSLVERPDGRWVARVSTPDGRRRAFYGQTRNEARLKLAAALRTTEAGAAIPSGRLTVGQFAADWLVGIRPTLRPSTWGGYERYLRLHVVPHIGRTVLGKLQPADLQRLYSDLITGGLKPASVIHVHAVLHKMLGQAARWDAVPRNVADLVDPPRVPRFEIAVLTPEQARTFLVAASADRLEALYVLAVVTGMRQGELLGLRWRDVDLDHGVLGVTGTLQRDGLKLAEPKTSRSRRSIELGDLAVDALRRRRAAQAEERLRAGTSWQDLDLVFATLTGGPINHGNLLRRSFYPMLHEAGLPRIRFHDLRHTAATLMLGEGVHPKVASEVLGHTTVGITLDLYSHVTKSMGRETAGIMNRLLSPKE